MKVSILACSLLLALASGAQEPETVKFVQKGDYYAAQGLFDMAVVEYEKALEAGAGSAVFLNRLANLYLQVGNIDRAVAILKSSLREQPGQLPVYSKLGEAFLAAGVLDSAIFYVREAALLAPEASPVHSSLGFLYLQAGDRARARAHLDTALKLDERNPEVHRFLGYYHAQADSLDQAIEHYLKLVKIQPDDVEAYNNAAFLSAQQQRYAQALEYYELARSRATDPYLAQAIGANMEAVRAIMDGKMRARFILVKTQTAARDLLRRLQEGEDFVKLAEKYSVAANSRDGGDVGFFGPGELMREFEEAVLQLKVGETSSIVQVPTGFMIIQRLN